MSRTTVGQVKALLNQDYDNDGKPALQPFIDAAAVIVSRAAAYAVTRGGSLSPAEQEILERWLAAHCYQQNDKGYTSRSTDSGSGSFQGQTGMFLQSTLYGQTALTLDNSGYLATLGKRRAGAAWLGKTASEQIDWVDRN